MSTERLSLQARRAIWPCMKVRRLINQTKIVFLVLFAIACAGIWAYQVMYAWPAKRCAAQGRWWLAEKRVCGVPVLISDITGRPTKTPAKPPAAPAPDLAAILPAATASKVKASKAAAPKAAPPAPAKP